VKRSVATPKQRRAQRAATEANARAAELLDAQPAPIGHNRPAPPAYAPMPAGAACSRCHHWKAPDPRDVSNYDHWQATGRGRRVKEPSGTCDRILHSPGKMPAFGGSMGRNACYNFEPDQRPKPSQDRRGFVTIYEGNRIVWQGTEGHEPAEYRQGELF
jgi:hypothetical protein